MEPAVVVRIHPGQLCNFLSRTMGLLRLTSLVLVPGLPRIRPNTEISIGGLVTVGWEVDGLGERMGPLAFV